MNHVPEELEELRTFCKLEHWWFENKAGVFTLNKQAKKAFFRGKNYLRNLNTVMIKGNDYDK